MIAHTISGVNIQIGRIDRRKLDSLIINYPPPKPPLKQVEAWGGIIEEIEDENDAEYVRESLAYRLSLGQNQFDIFAKAIKINDDLQWINDKRLSELIETGIAKRSSKDYLKYVLLESKKDLQVVIDGILYLSTVTDRGIREAKQLFDVTWYKQNIEAFRIKTTPGRYSRLFEDREASRFAQYSWNDFCSLWGYEQSAIVAHYRLKMRLDYLVHSETRK